MRDFDVVVVGAGPAGAASAIRCSQLGYSTLLVEREAPGRHKPCGGVLPLACAYILDDLELGIPPRVMCSPPTLGLFYVPPSGRGNGGSVKYHRFLNVKRDLFDRWLCDEAENSGVQVWYETEFLEFQGLRDIKIQARTGEGKVKLLTRYLIGADGVFSRVRRQLYPNVKTETLTLLQEHWRAAGNFGEYFYAFLNGNITPTYAYVIPKDRLFVIGTGTPKKYPTPLSTCISRFKEWLRLDFAFNPILLEKKEAAAIPYGTPLNGKENAVLVGDAAGFCNAFSGEGIRLAIESGIAAGEAVQQADNGGKPLFTTYAPMVVGLNELVRKTYEFGVGLTDEGREHFVRSEVT